MSDPAQRNNWFNRVFGTEAEELQQRVETLLAERQESETAHALALAAADAEAHRLRRERDDYHAQLMLSREETEALAARLRELARDLEDAGQDVRTLQRALSAAFGARAPEAMLMLVRGDGG